MYLIKDDYRLAFKQLYLIDKLQPKKYIVQVGEVFEQVVYFRWRNSEVNENVGFILITGELFGKR